LQVPGIAKLFDQRWLPVSFNTERFGLLPLITGSVMVAVMAGCIAVPFGVGGAVYINDLERIGDLAVNIAEQAVFFDPT